MLITVVAERKSFNNLINKSTTLRIKVVPVKNRNKTENGNCAEEEDEQIPQLLYQIEVKSLEIREFEKTENYVIIKIWSSQLLFNDHLFVKVEYYLIIIQQVI